MKQRQQKELADTLIAKVKKELENPKTLQLILQQSLQDVESMCLFFFPRHLCSTSGFYLLWFVVRDYC